jgi:hypothetical protein
MKKIDKNNIFVGVADAAKIAEQQSFTCTSEKLYGITG